MASKSVQDPYKRILILSSVLMAFLLIFCTVMVEFFPSQNDAIGSSFKATKAFLNAVSAVTSSILAAMLATLAISWYNDVRRQKTKAKFHTFFSISPGGEVIIVLPKFKVDVAEQNREDRGPNELCLKELTEEDRACVSWNDLIAARQSISNICKTRSCSSRYEYILTTTNGTLLMIKHIVTIEEMKIS